jgi:hypothetical protein
MAAEVSDKLREALERLDQAIDRLDAKIGERLEAAPAASLPRAPADPALAERLDTIIARIEAALVE